MTTDPTHAEVSARLRRTVHLLNLLLQRDTLSSTLAILPIKAALQAGQDFLAVAEPLFEADKDFDLGPPTPASYASDMVLGAAATGHLPTAVPDDLQGLEDEDDWP